MAIGKTHLRIREHAPRARPVDPARLDQRILHFPAMRARVHDQRPADRAGNAAQEREPIDARCRGGLGDVKVRRRRPGDETKAFDDLDRAERSAAEPDNEALYPAVTHDEVRTEADCRNWNFARQDGQEIGEIVLVGRRKQSLGRTADPKPGRFRNRRVGDEPPAQAGRPRLHLADKLGHRRGIRPCRARRVRRAAHKPIA